MSNETKVAFGVNQISAKTPAFAKWIFRAVLYIAAALNLIIGVVSEIPEPVRMIIAKYSLYAVTLVHGFSKLFGVQAEEVPGNDSNPETRPNTNIEL